MPSKIILFDLDGTLADYDKAMNRDLDAMASAGEERYGIHDKTAPKWFCNRTKIIRKQPGWWSNLERLQLGFEILDEAIVLGFEVHVLTKGPKKSSNAWTEKYQWCEEHLPSAVNVTVTRDKSTVYGLALVDDYPPFLEGWLEHRPRGFGIMPAHDGNANFEHPRVVRYDGTAVAMSKVRKILRSAYNREPGQAPNVES